MGGSFTSIGGQTRNRIAALNAATGAAGTWNPDADGIVSSLAVAGSTVYAGGYFKNIGGQARNYLAALDGASAAGGATSWNPNANGPVLALAVSGGRVYAAGSFTSIGGQVRKNLAALDAASGASPWGTYLGEVSESYGVAVGVLGNGIHAGFVRQGISGRLAYYFAQFDLPTADSGRLAATPASLGFLEGTRYAVDVAKGGAPTTRTLTLTNAGASVVTFIGGDAATPGLALSGRCAGDFKIVSVTPSTAQPLVPGASVAVTVKFAPTATARTLGLDAELVVTSDSPATPEVRAPLAGDAVPVEISGFMAE